MTAALQTAEVIAVGSELLGWTRLDTNSLYISEKLSALGIELKSKAVVGDDRARLKDLFMSAVGRVDVVLLTGGLGPTDDDVTREVVADALGLRLVEDAAITERIRNRFERRGMRMPEVNRRQALVPEGAVALPNAHGTAPGLFLETPKVVVLLPGPPRELRAILDALCTPTGALGSRAGEARIHRVSLFTTGRSESHVEEIAQPIYSKLLRCDPPIETTILATPGQVELHLWTRSADGPAALSALEGARRELVSALGDSVFTVDGRPLHVVVADLLRSRQLTLAAAESCTGGLFLQRMTEIPGSSSFVRGGIVAYNNELKTSLLGVDADLIAAHGAVSEPVAAAMADGVRERTGADVCVAITGVAGPGGGTDAKPVGTVVIAVQAPARPLAVHTHLFVGGREMVRQQSAQAALDRIRRLLA